VLHPPLEQTEYTTDFEPDTFEEWRTPDGFARYEVSSLGRVRNIESGRLANVLNKNGRPCVNLMRAPQRQTTVSLLSLVLETFGPPRPSLSHLARPHDGDTFNARANNLYWAAWNDAVAPKVKRARPPESIPGEEWRVCPSYPGYEVSSLGRFRNRTAGNFMTVRDRKGYAPTIGLTTLSGNQETCSAAQLVLEAFVGPPPNLRPRARYRDGDKRNLKPDNLYWWEPGKPDVEPPPATFRVRIGKVTLKVVAPPEPKPRCVIRRRGRIPDDFGMQDTARHVKPEFRGQNVGLSRLSGADTQQIRKRLAAGVPVNVISEEYGISTQNVRLFDPRSWRKL